MNTPPLLLGSALAFWGVLLDLPWLGALLAIGVEAWRIVNLRWDFTDDNYRQFWNICTVLFLGGAIFAFSVNDGASAMANLFANNTYTARSNALTQASKAVYTFGQWQPLFFFPIMLAQLYGNRSQIPLNAVSITSRWWEKRRPSTPGTTREFNASYPYLALCLFSPGIGTGQNRAYFPAMAIAMVWALWPVRSRRLRLPLWLALVAMAITAGWFIQFGIKRAEQNIEVWQANLFAKWTRRGIPADENSTAIGRIGRLKLSSQIVLRIEVPKGTELPLLLRENSYRSYVNEKWSSHRASTNNVIPETDDMTWVIRPIHATNPPLAISMYLDGGRGVLPIPQNLTRLEQLPVTTLITNSMGNVRVSDGPGLVRFLARGTGSTWEGIPRPDDLLISESERQILTNLVSELHLIGKPPAQIVTDLENFFAANFRYTTFLKTSAKRGTNTTALGDFLINTREGHCEYFATATTLMLRAAGVPARYSVGFSVSEQSGKYYLARERDGHAWCLAWVDGAWVTVDTTPGIWAEREREHRDWYEPIKDFFSGIWFQFSLFRWSPDSYKEYAILGIIPVLGWLGWRLSRTARRRKATGKEKKQSFDLPGADSPYYALEAALNRHGLVREAGETSAQFLLRSSELWPDQSAWFEEAIRFHYSLRFDPFQRPATSMKAGRERTTALKEYVGKKTK